MHINEVQRLRETLEDGLYRLDLERLGKYNRAYTKFYSAKRFESFILTEWPYYKVVVDYYKRYIPAHSSVLEIGTFIPVLPLLLSWEGYKVTTIENLFFYGNALDPMLQILKENNIEFIDADILEFDFKEKFSSINLLAVVEHLLGSPKNLLVKLRYQLEKGGNLLFAVPNQARLVRRIGLMFAGISVQPDFRCYFHSAYPFEGHHREYTMSEMAYALEESGYQIIYKTGIKYPPSGGFFKKSVTALGNLLPPTFHQMLFAVAQPREASLKYRDL